MRDEHLISLELTVSLLKHLEVRIEEMIITLRRP